MRALLLAALLAAPLLAPPAAAEELCYLEILGPDVHIRYCADPADPKCPLYYERSGREGEPQGRTCMVP